jgi:hypothetical protein
MLKQASKKLNYIKFILKTISNLEGLKVEEIPPNDKKMSKWMRFLLMARRAQSGGDSS